MSIMRCGFVGALVAGVLAFGVFVLVDVLMPHDTNEGKAWAEFALMMLGLSGVVVGFAAGAIIGAIRTLASKKGEGKGNDKS